MHFSYENPLQFRENLTGPTAWWWLMESEQLIKLEQTKNQFNLAGTVGLPLSSGNTIKYELLTGQEGNTRIFVILEYLNNLHLGRSLIKR